jgi:poly(3-hydroxybutyrate) depolymerase
MKTKPKLLAAGIFLAALGTGFAQPVITNQPQPQTVAAGSNATFTVGATSTMPLFYQWQKNVEDEWSDLLGRTVANLVLTNVQTSHAGDYRVVVTDATGTTNSDVASLTVMVPPGITRITNNNPFVGVGATVKMQVWVTGTTPSIQWYCNDLALSGKAALILTLANVQTTNSGLYTVVVTNLLGRVTSSPVSLEVTSRPQIQYTTALQHQAVHAGTSTSFAVTASGAPPLALQWRRDGQALAGQTNATLPFAAVQTADEGDYTVVVSNEFGVVTSEPARLWVVPPPSAFIRGDFTNGTFRYPYYYLMPTNYNPARSYPLVCFFHGAFGDENLFTNGAPAGVPGYGNLPVTKVFASYHQQAADPAIVIWPTLRAGDSWNIEYVWQATNLVQSLIAEFNIDTNRVYAGGLSAGGYPVREFVKQRANSIAAAMILDTSEEPNSADVTPVKDVPLWVVSAADGLLSGSRRMVRLIRLAGSNPIYTEYASGGHEGGIGMGICTPVAVDWLLAQRRGVAPTNEPLLAITNPAPQAVLFTGATNLNLAGSAGALDRAVTQVVWTNSANSANGAASGTNAWSVTGIPLSANKTNLIIVTGTTTSWAPAFGGNTTFNDTLAVIQSPIRAMLTLQGTDLFLGWTGGGPPYRVQRATDLAVGDWTDFPTNATPPVTLPLDGAIGFYRIVGQ